MTSSNTVVIVDYDAGNLLSVSRALTHLGATPIVSDDPKEISAAAKLLLPGVGAFGKGMEALRDKELIEPITAFSRSERPLLGICLGMQMLLDSSEEFGAHEGLGLIPGTVNAIADTDPAGQPIRMPHVGWNALLQPEGQRWQNSYLDTTPPDSAVYFVHSFAATPTHTSDCLANVEYHGRTVTAAVQRDNVTGFQFHPEKSGEIGLNILKRFLAI